MILGMAAVVRQKNRKSQISNKWEVGRRKIGNGKTLAKRDALTFPASEFHFSIPILFEI
jgi:hypothetical protein